MFFLFILYSLASLLSVVGFGFLFCKLAKFELKTYNVGLIGLLGLFFLSIISSYSHIIFKHDYFHNLFLLFIGLAYLIYFILNKKKKVHFKILFYCFFVLFIGFLIAKTNEDFPYYHLPNSLQFSLQKLQFGIGNLNHGFKHITSLFMLNSLYYFPFVKFYLFNITNFLFQIFFICFLIIEIINKNSSITNFSKNFLILTLILFLVKFNRLAEYGADIAGQILVFMAIFFALENLFNFKINTKNQIIYFKLLILFLVFAACTKVVFVIYFLIPLIILFNIKNKIIILNSIIKFRNLFFLILPIAFILFFNFTSTGCLLYPITETCFSNTFDWSLKKEIVSYMNYHYELWSKGGKGPNFIVDNPKEYLDGFNWIGNWISVYFFTKVTDYLGLILAIILFYSIFFYKDIFSENKKKIFYYKKFYILYTILFIVFLIWFSKFPTLRYAGYVIVFLIFILPYCLYLNNKINWSEDQKYKKFFSIIIICFSIFIIKNSIRLYKELNIPENQHHNYKNFPFYFVKNVPFNEIKINNHKIFHVLEGNMCWSTPPTCVRGNDSLNISTKNGYIFYSNIN